MTIPADSILLSGTCFINEGSITGDSISVLKESLRAEGK
jgi:magnesium-transporting ATPase (P-type)